jgi:hypothetical protein
MRRIVLLLTVVAIAASTGAAATGCSDKQPPSKAETSPGSSQRSSVATSKAVEAPPPEKETPLVASVLAAPHPVLGADNQVHLAYELFATNASSSVIKVEKVETLDAGAPKGSHLLSTLQGANLDQAIEPFVQGASHTLQPAQVSRIFMDVTIAKDARLPRSLEHQFSITSTPRSGDPTKATLVSGITDVILDKAVSIGPPVQGSRWAAVGGCCFPPSFHRTATLPVNGAFHGSQRFAVDLVQLDAQGRLFSGPKDRLSSYKYYGDKILSVADGVVVGAHDGEPENTPGKFPEKVTLQNVLGNYLVIDIGGGRYVFYAHMQPRSLRVGVGDQVKRGQEIGLLGDTGNTDAPHLHLHVIDGPGALSSNGLPFVIDSFGSEGTVTSSEQALTDGKPVVIGPALAGTHRNQMPLDDMVISFPASSGNDQ